MNNIIIVGRIFSSNNKIHQKQEVYCDRGYVRQ